MSSGPVESTVMLERLSEVSGIGESVEGNGEMSVVGTEGSKESEITTE